MAPIRPVISRNKVVGLIKGILMYRALCQDLAPSILAASSKSAGISCKAARYTIILKPRVYQIQIISIAYIEVSVLASQRGGSARPTARKKPFIGPLVG